MYRYSCDRRDISLQLQAPDLELRNEPRPVSCRKSGLVSRSVLDGNVIGGMTEEKEKKKKRDKTIVYDSRRFFESRRVM